MPPRNERVAAMVRAEITKNPNVDNDVLREKATAIDRAVRRLSPRQFHATYRLPALRSVNAAAPKPAPRPAAKSAPAKQAPAPTPAPAAAPAPAPAPAAEATPTPAPAPAPAPAPTPAHAHSQSKALARPHAAEREAVRGILQLVAREALVTEDRASFVRLLDSLDERANVILGLFGRG